MNKNLLMGIGVVVACAVIAGASLKNSVIQAKSFAEIKMAKATLPCEVYGKLDKNSIHAIKGGNLVEFAIIDEHSPERMKVVYHNDTIALPANFPTASHAKVQGVYDPGTGTFSAESVMTKCPSKYNGEDKISPDTQAALAKWQQQTGQKDAKASL